MVIVNMLDAKKNLSRLVEAVEKGGTEIVIARRGRPAARLVPFRPSGAAPLIGVAAGRFIFDKATFDAADAEIIDAFGIPPLAELPQP